MASRAAPVRASAVERGEIFISPAYHVITNGSIHPDDGAMHWRIAKATRRIGTFAVLGRSAVFHRHVGHRARPMQML